ncbi:Spo0E like sporulation regulatory protein [Falsibacillus pallidus]|uniref:Spo0E like sporulation regulatory protein n=2 Tax=Falsibacillus pallidus TaxID=493781 RepID=A0A370G8P2_9BACI|nr:Spo0E like sporulation regulatory protein [Falsibacillus pallidus]
MAMEMDIEAVRRKMIQTGLEKGLTHSDTVQLSKELDKLLHRVQLFVSGMKLKR